MNTNDAHLQMYVTSTMKSLSHRQIDDDTRCVQPNYMYGTIIGRTIHESAQMTVPIARGYRHTFSTEMQSVQDYKVARRGR